jgi:hypothetical protein
MAYIQDGQQSLVNSTSYYDDCLNRSSWDSRNSGTAATVDFDSTAAHPGVFRLQTGSTNAGEANCNYTALTGSNSGNFFFGGGPFIWTGYINIPVLATGGDDYKYYIGMHDGWQFADPSNGTYFQYIRANSVNWQIVSNNNSTPTTTTSSTAVSTGWHKLIMVATTSNVIYYVDGVSIGTISTNFNHG